MHIFYFPIKKRRKRNKKRKLIILMIFIMAIVTGGYQLLKDELFVPTFQYRDNRFYNKTIVIDAGHGGIDSGVIHSSGLMEKNINLEIAKHLRELLEEAGAKAVITREEDIELSPLSTIGGTRHQRDLNARVNIIDKNQADFFVSIHVNSFPQDANVKGPIAFYCPQSEVSKNLAEVVQNRLNIEYQTQYKKKQNTLNKARGEAYYILKNTKSPGVIVEVGFMSNQEEYKLLKKTKFRYFTAYQIYIALGEFLHQ